MGRALSWCPVRRERQKVCGMCRASWLGEEAIHSEGAVGTSWLIGEGGYLCRGRGVWACGDQLADWGRRLSWCLVRSVSREGRGRGGRTS